MNDNVYEVTSAQRKRRRDITKTLNNDFLKYITEILLNSDDSYSRLESKTNDSKTKMIDIYLNRTKRSVRIIDGAEGMSSEEMRKIFTEYGSENSRGGSIENVRGLFGQGASDVIFSSAVYRLKSYIASIKDNQLTICSPIFNEKQEVRIQTFDNVNEISKFKKRTGIRVSGTEVFFNLNPDVSIPQKRFIKSRIENYYMLRFLLSNPKREVNLHDGQSVEKLDSSRYLWSKKDLLSSTEFKLRIDNRLTRVKYDIYNKIGNESFDESKIIIIDQNNVVYDNTDLGMGGYHGLNDIRGLVVIHDLYKILRDNLNKREPIELLRDSRDGFDQREKNVKTLFSKLRELTKQVIKSLEDEKRLKNVSLSSNNFLKSVLNKINKYYRELELREIGNYKSGDLPPDVPFKFVREKARITHRKQYNLKLLVNSEYFVNDDNIIFKLEGDNVTYHPPLVTIKKDESSQNNLQIKNLVIKGESISETANILEAYTENHSSKIEIHVINENIYYPELMEFRPSKAHLKINQEKEFSLFINTSVFPIYSYIRFKLFDVRGKLIDEVVENIYDDHLIGEDVAKLTYQFKGSKKETDLYLFAICDTHETKVKIEIWNKDKDVEEGLSGLLSDVELEKSNRADWQTEYRKEEGKIYINKSNPINIKLLEPIDMLEKISDAKSNQSLNLIDLVCFEASKLMVLNDTSSIANLASNEILAEINKFKTKIFSDIVD